ncbi:MAG: fumarylacetoacetate hydrolase family protein [Parvibaculaceae bacterium]|nr:fumarylacetoacetate hydrolase family protein [Parvibaculaceae bacterium]
MKFFRWGPKGQEKPGVLDADGVHRDISDLLPDIAGHGLGRSMLNLLQSTDLSVCPIVPAEARRGPCVGRVGKFICVGLNYADHAAESGMDVPEEPVLFFKATSAICGPDDDIIIPRAATKTDWEVELGVVIGKDGAYIDVEDAQDHIAGYCVINDLSERAFQLERSGQWVKGKSADTFGPIGPYLVTPDEVPDPSNLNIWLEIDGKRVQNGNTRTMIFKVPFLVSYISQFMSLQAGDVISTGTPPGVGLGMEPPTYLRAGQKMRVGIDGLGEQNQMTVPWQKTDTTTRLAEVS